MRVDGDSIAGDERAVTAQASAIRAPLARLAWETESARGELLRKVAVFTMTLAQFGVIYVLLKRLDIETQVTRRVFRLALLGFAVHYWLPPRLRLGFFALLSLVSVALVFGMTGGVWDAKSAAIRGGWLTGLGFALIALSLLPGPRWARVASIAAVGALLAACRAGAIATPIPATIWPILGAMFMFRIIIFLYDTARETTRMSPVRPIAYFFALPNACFPFFPVLDYKGMHRAQFDTDPARIYQKGLWWMTRGIVHLILYRAVYNNWRVGPGSVFDGADLATFMLSSMALYLRVSGQLHLIVGLLHMFGFNLPETNRRYFFASSFNDYWRRVNIYWKEFVLKVIYKPAYFRLKGLGLVGGMAAATIVAFVATWFLHAYQMFWLRGSFPIQGKDIAFWGALGLLVTANSVWEAKFGRARSLGVAGPRGLRPRALLALRVAGTFLTLTILWSVWHCASVRQWADIITVFDATTAIYLLGGALLVGLMATIPVLDPAATVKGPFFRGPVMGRRFLLDTAIYVVLPAGVLLTGLDPRVYSRLPVPIAEAAHGIRRGVSLLPEEEAEQVRGYYEAILGGGQSRNAAADMYARPMQNWKGLESSGAVRPVEDMRGFEFVPGADVTLRGVRYAGNILGNRDRERTLEKPGETFRIAVLGSSHVMGLGVDLQRTFAYLLEEEFGVASGASRPAEFWNFAFNGYSPMCQLVVLDERVSKASPDVALYVAHAADIEWTVGVVARAAVKGTPPLSEPLAAIAAQAGIRPGMDLSAARRRLRARADDVVALAYADIVERARRLGAHPVWVHLPLPHKPERVQFESRLREIAQRAGFTTLSAVGVFQGRGAEELCLSEADFHYNAHAHEIVAARLKSEIRACPAFAPLFGETAPAGAPRPAGK